MAPPWELDMVFHGSGEPARPDALSLAIDRSVLGEWVDGDEDAIDAMLAIFSESVRLEQGGMRGALEQNDIDRYRHCAHRLRGAALAMGAKALGGKAAALENAAKAGDFALCVSGMGELDGLVHQVVNETSRCMAPDPEDGRTRSS